jgi:hypothetical protein
MIRTNTKEDTHYQTLGLSESASAGEIKRAYRKLAKELHPDVNQNDEIRMKAINRANEVLSEENKKKKYDKKLAADRAKEAEREERKPSPGAAKAFGEGLRDHTEAGGRPSAPNGSPPNSTTTPPPRPYPRFEPTRLRTTPRTWSPPAQPLHPPTPSPTSSQPAISRLRAMASRLAGNFFGKLGVLALALAFAAAPVGIMYLWAPVFNSNQHNIVVDVIGLGLGVGCLAWLFAGFAAVLGALGNLFSDW